MNLVVAITQHGGVRLAEVGFLLDAIAGVVFAIPVAAPSARLMVRSVGGLALAVGSLLLIIAVHWGRFG